MWSLGYVQTPDELAGSSGGSSGSSSSSNNEQKETNQEKILINNILPSVTDGSKSPTNLESSITSTDTHFFSEGSKTDSDRSETAMLNNESSSSSVPYVTMRKLEHQSMEIDEDFVFIEPSQFKETCMNRSILKTGFYFEIKIFQEIVLRKVTDINPIL